MFCCDPLCSFEIKILNMPNYFPVTSIFLVQHCKYFLGILNVKNKPSLT